VLDIGIGTGLFAEFFAAQGAHIVGVDLSPRMLVHCAEKHPDWSLHEGHFLALPVSDASADLAVSAFAFHHLKTEERPAALLAVMRALRPQKTFLLLDILFRDQDAKAAARRALEGAWEEENYATLDELLPVANELGLAATFTQVGALHAAVTI